MKTGARLAAIAEILDLFLKTLKPLDSLIHSYFLQRRYAGSKDRRFIKDHLYFLFRHWQEITWKVPLPLTSRTLLISYFVRVHQWSDLDFQKIVSGSSYDFEALTKKEQENLTSLENSLKDKSEEVLANVPNFLWPEFKKTFGDQSIKQALSLKKEAYTDLRVNTIKTNRLAVLTKLKDLSIEAFPTPYANTGIRLKNRYNLENTDLFEEGMIEIQDEGSQLLAEFCSVHPYHQVLDFCAGAGGKSLALGAMMHNQGRIVATDWDSHRLKLMIPRLKRSGLRNIVLKEFSLQDELLNSFDLVLVDAPCSGTGTWRRAPDLRLRFTERDLQMCLEKQQSILMRSAQYVRSGGRLIYGTCSMLDCENHNQTLNFSRYHPQFKLNKVFQISPLTHETDGFYGAELYKI